MGLSVLTIHETNLVHNYQAIKEYVGTNINVAAILKCNAYGLGASEIISALLKVECKDFYVATLSEALQLRAQSKDAKIYVLYGLTRGQEEDFLIANLIPVLNNLHQVELWEDFAAKAKDKLKCCVHIDTGMTRSGLENYRAEDILTRLAKSKYLTVMYVLSHLACADHPDAKMNEEQLNFLIALRSKHPQFRYSVANSAGIFLGAQYHFDQVRPGIALYGGHPLRDVKKDIPIKLLPTVELHSKIIDLHSIQDNHLQRSVGYGATHKLVPGATIASVPIGYGDGYPISLSNKGYCCINGIKVPIVGRISMDYLCIDVSSLPDNLRRIGQEVEMIGKNISIEEIASLADTINYEILTSLGGRYERKYINN